MEAATACRLHEHAGHIALKFNAPCPTVYITPALAKALAVELLCAETQVRNGFHYPTTTIGV